MEKNIGFIGGGRMAQAMIEGMIGKRIVLPEQIKASTATEGSLTKLIDTYHILGSLDNQEVASFADYLFLAVHPSLYPAVIEQIKNAVKSEVIIITIAAGISIKQVETSFGRKIKVIRTMPNTPSLVGEGMTALSPNSTVNENDLAEVLELLNSFGKTQVFQEHSMDAVPAISGSSPAYVYMFIEALADGGVRDGIPRKDAYIMAAQAVLGAAKMVLETGKHPGALKDDVCTPGGSTIEAVAALESSGFRKSVLDAMKACTDKNKEMGNK
ncbi:pyrroline-5-carboxylate reductase [Peribacillus psychrosaccharolyticus]|uniref:pyrroline-5-carboxylate reductase n=1 Tax=Peribacillus psychrosaccharolyticus TaxID=1407 RepID=UPI003D2BBAD0